MSGINKKLIVITKDNVIVEKVENYHSRVAKRVIREYFQVDDDIVEAANKEGIEYAELMADTFGVVVLIVVENTAAMYIPENFNEYQLEQIKGFGDMAKDLRKDGIPYSIVPKYKHNIYYDLDELFKFNNGLKR